MTKNAMEFITPLTFQTLSKSVAIEMFKSLSAGDRTYIFGKSGGCNGYCSCNGNISERLVRYCG